MIYTPKLMADVRRKRVKRRKARGGALGAGADFERINPHQKQELIAWQAGEEGKHAWDIQDPKERAELLERGWERIKKEENAIVDENGDVLSGRDHDEWLMPEAMRDDDADIPGYSDRLDEAMCMGKYRQPGQAENEWCNPDESDYAALQKIKDDFHKAKRAGGSQGLREAQPKSSPAIQLGQRVMRLCV